MKLCYQKWIQRPFKLMNRHAYCVFWNIGTSPDHNLKFIGKLIKPNFVALPSRPHSHIYTHRHTCADLMFHLFEKSKYCNEEVICHAEKHRTPMSKGDIYEWRDLERKISGMSIDGDVWKQTRRWYASILLTWVGRTAEKWRKIRAFTCKAVYKIIMKPPLLAFLGHLGKI